MKIVTHHRFDKSFRKLQPKLQSKFYKQLEILSRNIIDHRLNNHALTGKYLGYRSFDVMGDIRVIFEHVNNELIKLVNIGTHSQLNA